MPYSLNIQNIPLPNGNFALYIPIQGEVSAEYLARQQHYANAPFPYWARLWPSAIALATFIQYNPHYVAGKRVAELAAGVGLPSLVAASYASHVWCSDISADAMQVAAKSATYYQLTNIRFETCNWNDLPDDFNADVVLLSDINYEPSVFDELEKILTSLLKKGCTLLLATPQRLMAKPFIETLLPFVISQTVEVVKENGPLNFISIFTLKIN